MSALPERIEHADERQRELPHSLWERLRADPARAPEYVALAASERHAPAAAAWVEERKRTYASSPAELAQMAKRRHAALARFGGAATGFGGIVTAIPDLAAAAWIQSRLVFFIAAAYGYDPYDPMRPAELLVIRDLYSDPLEARRALDGIGTMMAEAYVGSKMQRDEALAARLARFVGRRLGRRFAGRLIPFAAIAFNAIGNERETRALADKAIKFYGGERGRPRLPGERQRRLGRSGCEWPRHDETVIEPEIGAQSCAGSLERLPAGSLASLPSAVTPAAPTPFRAADSGEHSHRISAAIRCGGTSLSHDDSGIDSRFAGVSISEGRTTLQRTPSLASARASAVTAAFEAA